MNKRMAWISVSCGIFCSSLKIEVGAYSSRFGMKVHQVQMNICFELMLMWMEKCENEWKSGDRVLILRSKFPPDFISWSLKYGIGLGGGRFLNSRFWSRHTHCKYWNTTIWMHEISTGRWAASCYWSCSFGAKMHEHVGRFTGKLGHVTIACRHHWRCSCMYNFYYSTMLVCLLATHWLRASPLLPVASGTPTAI